MYSFCFFHHYTEVEPEMNMLIMCCYIAAVKALLIPFYVQCFALYIPFHNHQVIKVQIVLSSLLPIHMAGREWRIFLKAFIFQVIAPLCLQGAVQVLLFFHFPDMFWVSGKLPPIILTAICLAPCFLMLPLFLTEICGSWTDSRDEFLMGYHAVHL